MQSCELIIAITTLAVFIAEEKSVDELTLLASSFNQLGDTLATIAAHNSLCTMNDYK